MAITKYDGVRVSEFLGWKAALGSVVLGFKSARGDELALSLSVETAERAIAAITAAVAQAKAMAGDVARTGVTYEFAMKVSGAAYGITPGTDEVFARMHLASGGSLGFSMDKEFAHSFASALTDIARPGAVQPKLLLH